MSTWAEQIPSPGRAIALLRGVNVSGRRRLPMGELRRSLEELGLRAVRTYVQSGNAVFDVPEDFAGGRAPSAVAAAVRDRIAADFGHDVEVLVVPASHFREIVAGNPFAAEAGIDERWLHVTFLFTPTVVDRQPDAHLPAAGGERAVVTGPVVYLSLPHGYGRTKLNNSYFERAYGTAATTRNWRTVLALGDLLATP